MTQSTETKWDVVVVGGGPAGMTAASNAAEAGARVILLEKNETLGKKLLITGGGRCNVTNAEPDVRKFLQKYKSDGKFLFSAFSIWSVQDTLNFFHQNGMETKVENEYRVFPISNSAQSVWDVLVEQMKKNNVTVRSNAPVVGVVRENGAVVGVELKHREIIRGTSIIIATGGTSRPETGSTGDAYAWLEALGHIVTTPTPSLVPVAVKDAWVRKLAGISMTDVKITILQNNTKQNVVKGKILFTHVGLSGPAILNLSKDIGELLKYGEVVIELDPLPALDHGMLNEKLQEILKTHNKKKIANALAELVPSTLVAVVTELSDVDGNTPCNSITREERLKLIETMKHISLHVDKLLGVEKAIITNGGVELSEVDFKTMQSRLFPNLYLIGDILNIDRPSGGYSLQLCWTTGYVAGTHASQKI